MSNKSIYDENNYYGDDKEASRLSLLFNPFLYILDYLKAYSVFRYFKNSIYEEKLSVLDVGAGDGKFLSFFKHRSWIVEGTTLSIKSKNAAKIKFNINLHFSELINNLFINKFDLITYWHVYEHLNEPKKHYIHWKNMLTEKGVIVIEIPNIESYGSCFCFDTWLGSDIKHHCNLVNEKKLLKILKDNDLQFIRTDYFSLKFSYVFLWSGLIGYIFKNSYDFDFIMSTLQNPKLMLNQYFYKTLNLFISVLYLSPVIFFFMIKGVILKKGEVLRVYAKLYK